MINIFVCSGRLTADPELRQTTNGKLLARFSIANDTGFGRNKQTTFFSCTAWGALGETVSKCCHKGDAVFTCGSMVANNYTDKNGKKQVSYDYVVREVQFVGKRKNNDADGTGTDGVFGFSSEDELL